MKSSHVASIGRKVWLWMPNGGHEDTRQAFDATVIYVHPDGDVKLRYMNHLGTSSTYSKVELRDPSDDTTGDFHGKETAPYATWMPYQKKQMDSQK